MPKRGNNIYKRADGRWEGRILKEDIFPGEARYKYVYGKTYGETRKKMETIRQSMKKRCPDCQIAVEEAVNLWLKGKKDFWKVTTYFAYCNLTRKYIIPILGSCKISEIDDRMLDKFVSKIRHNEKGRALSNGYLRNICSVIIMVLHYMKSKHHFAVEIPDNPVALCRKNTMMLPGDHDLKKLEDYLLSHMTEDGTSLGILTSLYTGIRIGELCALKWESINLRDEVICVRQNIQRVKIADSTAIVFQTPKTVTSTREIPIPPVLLPFFVKYKGGDDEFLVKGKKKDYAEPRTMEYRLSRILEKCSIKQFHFHMLRHTFATRCITMGFDVKSLSELLGHSNIQTTLNLYVHSSKQHKKQLMNLFSFPEQKEQAVSF